MRLDKNSISARLYKYFYNLQEWDSLPQSLCPYFWKLVVAYLLVLPLFILTLPVIVMDKITKDDCDYPLPIRAFFGILLLLLLFFIGLLVMIHIKGYGNGTKGDFYAALTMDIIFGVVSLVFFIAGLINRASFNSRYTDKKPNLVFEFVKAKYNRYCPKIDWVEEDTGA